MSFRLLDWLRPLRGGNVDRIVRLSDPTARSDQRILQEGSAPFRAGNGSARP
jgi:hypothetical protein